MDTLCPFFALFVTLSFSWFISLIILNLDLEPATKSVNLFLYNYFSLWIIGRYLSSVISLCSCFISISFSSCYHLYFYLYLILYISILFLFIYHFIYFSNSIPFTIFSAISSLVSLSSQSLSLSIYLPISVFLPLTPRCSLKPPYTILCHSTGYINGVSLPPIEIILSALTFYQPKNINSRISRNPIVPRLRLCHRTELWKMKKPKQNWFKYFQTIKRRTWRLSVTLANLAETKQKEKKRKEAKKQTVNSNRRL